MSYFRAGEQNPLHEPSPRCVKPVLVKESVGLNKNLNKDEQSKMGTAVKARRIHVLIEWS